MINESDCLFVFACWYFHYPQNVIVRTAVNAKMDAVSAKVASRETNAKSVSLYVNDV